MKTFSCLLLLFEFSKACMPAYCGETSKTDYCMEYSKDSDSYLMQSCLMENYTCPHPSHMSEEYPLQCEYWIDKRFWDSSSWKEYYQYTVLGKESNCDPYGLVSVCDKSKDLVCYCSSDSCKCVAGLEYGEDCETNPTPCIPGFVCSNKICTKMYSVKAGDEATNSLACEGGGPLVILEDKFICRQGPKTLGGIPKPCSNNNDCISDTGSETTECVCGLNTDGQGYCKLHFSDSPMVNWRNSARDQNYKLEIYWKFMSVNYPYLQGNLGDCLGTVWKDFYEYKLGEPKTDLNFSTFIMSIKVLTLLIFINF